MRLSGWQPPLEQVSASSLSLFVQCPERFRLKYLLKQKEKMYPDRFVGLVDHETHEHNFKWKIDTGRDMNLDTLKEIFQVTWIEREEKEMPEWGPDSPNDLYDLVWLMVETYHNQVSPGLSPVACEQRFEERIEGLPVPLVGYIDLMEQDKVIDRKTAKQKVSKAKSKWRFQGRIYSLVTDMPVEWHVITKQKTPMVYTAADYAGLRMEKPNADTTVRMIHQAAHRLNEMYASYGPDHPWPADGLFHDWLCDYCTWGPQILGSCHAWKEIHDPATR